jgi:prophage antirepressor-like protein
MEIIKAFENNNMNMHITIQGTYEEPLFRATDIGAILDIAAIRSTIRDFDSTEKEVQIVDTKGGPQEVIFLTEKGLYQVLFTSRKPIAKKFKNWVCELIKEIRLNGKYELKKQLIDIIEQKEQNLLKNFHNKPILYLGFAEDNIIKGGYTNDIESRLADFKREIRLDFTFEYVYESVYNREIEAQLFQHPLVKPRRLSKKYNGKIKTELFRLDNKFTLKDLDKIILEIKKEIESIEQDKEKNNEINNLKLQLAELKIKLTEKNDIKIYDQVVSVKQNTLSKIKEIKEFIPSREFYNEVDVNDETREFLVVRNIKTTIEKLFNCPTRAANFLNFDPKAIIPYIDSPMLIHGHHVRLFGNPYWQPHKEFIYNEKSTPYKNNRSIKSINLDTGEICIYESTIEASRILGKDDAFRARIGKYVNKDKIFITDDTKLKWIYITNNSYGDFIKSPNSFDFINDKEIKKIVKIPVVEKYKIIARNIKTFEETSYKTVNEAKKIVGNSDISNYINVGKHIKGYTFRTVDCEKYWVPPENFKFIENYISKTKFYVKTINKISKEVTYYNSAFEMAIFFNLCKLTDTNNIKENMRELVKRITSGEVKTSNYSILNEHIFEELEICGNYN